MKALLIGGTFFIMLIIVAAIYIPLPNVLDVPLIGDDELYAGHGEVCSTPAYNIDCQEGLTCSTMDGKVNFDPRKETGYCLVIE